MARSHIQVRDLSCNLGLLGDCIVSVHYWVHDEGIEIEQVLLGETDLTPHLCAVQHDMLSLAMLDCEYADQQQAREDYLAAAGIDATSFGALS